MTSFTQENLGRGDQKVRELLIIVVEEMGDYVKNYTFCIYHRIMDTK